MGVKKSRKKTIILLFLIIVTVLSATYAYTLISSSNNTASSAAGCFSVNYTGTVLSNALVSTTDYTQGTHAQVALSKNENCAIYNTATIYIHTDTSTTAPIAETEALKYKVLSGNTIISEGLINITGDLAIATVPLTTTSTTYDVYIWLDSEISQGLFNGTTYSGHIFATADQTSTIKPVSNVITEEVLEPNATNDSSLDFSQTSDASSTNGIYLRNDTQNDTYPIYYYRGNVNNNLIFADFCWKIVRTTETGGLKLIYNGVPSDDGKCNNTGSNSEIGKEEFNYSPASPAYVGYMYGTPYTSSSKSLSSSYVYGKSVSYANGTYTLTDTTTQSSYSTTLNDYHYTCFSSTGTTCTSVSYVYYVSSSTGQYITLSNGKKVEDALSEMLDYNTNSSTIKGSSTTSGTLDYWYYINIEQKGYSNYIEDTIWCNDRSIYQLNGWNPDGGSLTNSLLFSAYNRVYNTYQPSLTCSRQVDRFTVSDSNGNGDLTYPVGLLTADEIMLAGGASAENSSYYLYGGEGWTELWAGSPSDFASVPNEFNVNYIGVLANYTLDYGVDSSLGVRPSVSLAPGFALASNSGTGTGDSPYVVE